MDKEFYDSLYNILEQFKPNKITDKDIMIARKVANQILINGRRNLLFQNTNIELLTLLNSVSSVFYDIGCFEASDRCYSILSNTNYYVTPGADPYLFTSFGESVDCGEALVAKRTVSIAVPDKVNDTSKIFMAHEISHALKEENPNECKLVYQLAEVIPILIELIAGYNKGRIVFREVVNSRINILYSEAYQFNSIYNKIKDYDINNIPNYLCSALGSSLVYLNSFYYSVALFNIYLSYPKVIIRFVNMVLDTSISSLEMINAIIYSKLIDDYNEEYYKGLEVIKRI